MNIAKRPSSLTRPELAESWRSRLGETRTRYLAASDRYRKLLQALPDGLPAIPNGALALAHQEESQALDEYIRVLCVLTELTVHGKVPDEQPVTSQGGV